MIDSIIKILGISLIATVVSFAQNSTDALRYSYLNPQGTARAMGVGGAMGALGGDFTSVAINPAGIAGYWKSEFMFTPAYSNIKTVSSLNDNPSSEQIDNQFNISNLGIVFANTPQRGPWKSVSLGFGINKMASFQQEFFYQGETSGSITDRFAGLGTGIVDPDFLDPYEAGLAFETGAIYDIQGDGIYETDFVGSESEMFNKEQFVTTSGYFNEMSIAFGGNFKDQLLLGVSVGIPFIMYESEKNYLESDPNDVIPAFNELTFGEYLTTEGGGVNVKIGAIAKINRSFRVGAAFHSPTFMTLTDRFTTDLRYDFDQGSGNESYSAAGPEGEFEYGLTTPWRAVANASMIIGKSGFVSADVEYIDYSSAKFNFTRNSNSFEDREYQDEVNQEIKDIYGGAVNVRLGGELAVDAFRVRGGVQLLTSPFVGDNTMQSTVTLGAGVRGNKAFLDLSFNYNNQKEAYLPYAVSGAPQQVVDNKINRSQILMTIGFKI